MRSAVLELDADSGANQLEPVSEGPTGRYSVDARNAAAVQVGDGSTQINYNYQGVPWPGTPRAPQVGWAGPVESPYRGLSAYGERDAAFFFGREPAATEIIERMSRRLEGPGLVVLSGVSGVGKSSLVRAGVLPRLRGAGLPAAPGSATWPCLVFTPARAPLDELAVRVAGPAGADAAAVRRGLETDPAGFALTARQAALNATLSQAAVQLPWAPDPRLILVVDQFEQLFTQCPDERERDAFVRALCAAADRNLASQRLAALVVLIVRADFEARCADYPGLAPAVQDRYLILPMTERQLRAAITEPAKLAGGRIDGDLVDVLLREAGSQLHEPASGGRRTVLTSPAGVLPLVSYALDQAWRQSTGDTVTIGDYERTGGIESAVANSAQHAYERLTSDQQAAARQVFIRLTATSPDGIDVARRVRRADLTEGKNPRDLRDVEHVLDQFVTERLLTVDAGTVEISHEVLLAAWPLLRDDWLAETHADRVVRTRLSGVVAEWTRSSRNPSYLYGGTVLEAATAMAARAEADPASVPPPSREERDFLDLSIRAERRKARRRQGIIALLTAAAVVLTVAAVLAEAARAEADRQRDANASRQLAFQSQIIGTADPEIADLEAVAAWRISPSSQARYALLAAAARPETAVLPGSPGPVNPVTFSPDGKFVATGSLTVRLWNAGTLRPASRPLASGIGQVNSIAFSPDSRVLAIAGGNQAGDSGVVDLRYVPSGKPAGRPLRAGLAEFNAVAFSPDGRIIAACGGGGQVWLWSARTHRLLATLGHARAIAEALAFSPDGKSLVVAGYAGTQLWDVATGHLIAHLQDRGEYLNAVAFSPDGRVIATGGQDGQVRLWSNAGRHLLLRRLAASGTGSVNSLAFRAGWPYPRRRDPRRGSTALGCSYRPDAGRALRPDRRHQLGCLRPFWLGPGRRGQRRVGAALGHRRGSAGPLPALQPRRWHRLGGFRAARPAGGRLSRRGDATMGHGRRPGRWCSCDRRNLSRRLRGVQLRRDGRGHGGLHRAALAGDNPAADRAVFRTSRQPVCGRVQSERQDPCGRGRQQCGLLYPHRPRRRA